MTMWPLQAALPALSPCHYVCDHALHKRKLDRRGKSSADLEVQVESSALRLYQVQNICSPLLRVRWASVPNVA